MIFTIVIILIVALIVVAIVVNAVQQHRERIEAEKRTEVAKQRAIIDETENVLMAADSMPVSQQLVHILHQRIYNALKVINEMTPGVADIKQRIKESEERSKAINVSAEPPAPDAFRLPDNDKLIIQYIQAIKKFRVLLRSEHSKGKVDSSTFAKEDRLLAALQLRVNVETLIKRGNAALQTGMMGSARQYFEKAKSALEAQNTLDDYAKQKLQSITEQLKEIQDNLRNANAEDRKKKKSEENGDLDELFAPKKKW
ncbi:hypothetical protein OE749_11260 [Aestuariibacter sp. AA17]|uniref:DNA repair protein n=1 Tax=Fluctibacter corallii TaxID=2984329 RepID=A0ABT3A9B1_9ALTE|nr:hypothetical protein [Aestuariibacter sp. AA17]MCV2885270.1 hypothetical protein [Aestuariibacter sp. AA17]